MAFRVTFRDLSLGYELHKVIEADSVSLRSEGDVFVFRKNGQRVGHAPREDVRLIEALPESDKKE